jgi:hypothetical protein
MKQIDYDAQARVGFSIDTCHTDTDAWAVFECQSMRFGKWFPAGIAAHQGAAAAQSNRVAQIHHRAPEA